VAADIVGLLLVLCSKFQAFGDLYENRTDFEKSPFASLHGVPFLT
jgi:hypothetical protein